MIRGQTHATHCTGNLLVSRGKATCAIIAAHIRTLLGPAWIIHQYTDTYAPYTFHDNTHITQITHVRVALGPAHS